MKIREAILKASDKIDYIDAKTLMKYYLDVDENYIIANGYNSFSNKQIHEYFELVDQVANGYPVQYICLLYTSWIISSISITKIKS